MLKCSISSLTSNRRGLTSTPQWEWRTARVQNMASVMGVVTMKGRIQAGTWATLTTLSADHILTWSPELHSSKSTGVVANPKGKIIFASMMATIDNLFFGWDVAKVRLGSC